MIAHDLIDELRGLAPTPDYRSDLPADVDICSCDESLALRCELALARRRIVDLERSRPDGRGRALAAAWCEGGGDGLD
jgi:hypothetical protein